MSIFTLFKSHPFIISAIATVLAVAGIAGGVLAWGPDRPTFTAEVPADYITFNSITDNSAYGDERNFFRVKPADAPNSAYSDNVALEAGKEYQGYVYFHNNAAANLNLVARDTTMRVELPAVVDGGAKTNAFINSPDAKPVEVFDDATLTSSSAVAIRMVPGSATIYSNGAVNGQKLDDSLITSGVKLGYDKLDGKVSGCSEFAGYVTFRFVADQPNFTVEKQVSEHGKNKWSKSYQAQPNETVDFLLKYKNTGTTLQKDVVIKDSLPKGMTYVTGSTTLGNPSNPQGVKTNDGVTATTGINVGSYNPGQNAWIIFSAKVDNKETLKCGENTLENKQIVETNNGSKSDTAKVVVTKTCPTPEPEPELKKIKVCRLKDKKYPVTIEESSFDSNKHSMDPADCEDKPTPEPEPQPEKIKVCDTKYNKIVNIDQSAYDENRSRYTADLSKCDEAKEGPAPEEPVAELPQTGPSGPVMSLVGLGTLSYTTALYLTSRRKF